MLQTQTCHMRNGLRIWRNLAREEKTWEEGKQAVQISSLLKKGKGCQEEKELDLFCVAPVGGDLRKIFGYLPKEEIWPTFSLL